ncbi:LRR receptor-like serine/threonine-protein kinase IOS1 isoform X2 [Hevea brasiliensis]|uniref:LRR receptor-like serine/threonine-protein kinase IOS1 isoform X2 n=1 Tax=Hevea brasiliensis TaxID=3981 RepID=UPI0025CE63ED|nr:LRR receptor-like serine/threonine-protein kinase IOS1 isoform X2 [Hevea brasiliensis]
MAASRKLDANGISGKKLKAEMEILQCFLVVLLSAIVLTTLAHAQDQTGTNKWSTVQLEDAIRSFSTEIIHVTARSYVFVCLVNTDSGTPFISALELRPLHNATYNTETGSLVLARRLDIGSTTNATVRFPNDIYDRVWQTHNWAKLISSQTDDYQEQNSYDPPSSVMTTAVTSTNATEPLSFSIGIEGSASQYYTYMHFAEIAILQANQSREFDVYLNGQKWYGPIFPRYLSTNTIFTRSALNGGKFQFSLNKTGDATLPPLINAIEIYTVLELLQPQSDQEDVDAIMNIKSAYRIERNWQGDPCSPPDYLWEGLNCSYNDDDLPRIISLNLSSSGLTGEINRYISNLTLLQSLDLSNNSLTGSVPDFLSKLSSLKFLNLSGNQLTGTVPPPLTESVGGNPELCASVSCNDNNNKKKYVVPVAVSVAALFVIIGAALAIWRRSLKRRKKQEVEAGEIMVAQTRRTSEALESRKLKRQFTYFEVVQITNNFGSVLGRGGFGTVYHGYLDDIEVAVKTLSPSSVQGYKEFQAEVKLLLRVHHKNLTSLVGYCEEANNMVLIYEYMANGNLKHHLSGEQPDILSWEGRLRVALEAAQGLEYLHNGCKPPIVHRDVKTTNILLDAKFQAKLSDFGLSRIFPNEDDSHVTTTIAGTPGYLDPEYNITTWLTEKSDVYSFGVVLLEIITSRPVIAKNDDADKIHLSNWVSSMLDMGDIKAIADPRLHGDFDVNSLWKVTELAMACVSETSSERPNMTQVVMELKECLATEMARTREGSRSPQSNNAVNLMALNLHTEISPLAR